jgi:hypothetical protein
MVVVGHGNCRGSRERVGNILNLEVFETNRLTKGVVQKAGQGEMILACRRWFDPGASLPWAIVHVENF